jgi:hypothetical protein
LENDSAFLVGKNAHNKNSRGNQYTKFIEASGEDIEDGAMIQIMANENMSEWGHSIIVTDETVKVAKEFLENDEAFLPTKKASKWKNTKAENGQASGEDIADFLGWGSAKNAESFINIE